MPAYEVPSRTLRQVARVSRMRALAWSGEDLYVARQYQLMCATLCDVSDKIEWRRVAAFHPAWLRRLSSVNRLSSRLLRDGFHALAILPSGALVAAVAGAIVTLPPGEKNFRVTHEITRGTRPLHIAVVPDGTVYWGESHADCARSRHRRGAFESGPEPLPA